ncbi:MAG: RimK family alpha-L-glutamate ligase [Candidatus Woesearchaeota archaeon]
MKKAYLSIREDIEQVPEHKSSDHTFAQRLNEMYDLHLVHPCEYDLETLTVGASYQYESPDKKTLKQPRHTPEGDLFIIFSDGSNRNRGLDFALREYEFLNTLKQENMFQYFFNEPETEEKTLKSGLIELSENDDMIAETQSFTKENVEEMTGKYGSVVAKPIFGSQMAGVQLLHSLDDIKGDISYFEENYVLQEPLEGYEKRIVVMDGRPLFSRIHKDRPNPWRESTNPTVELYSPTPDEMAVALRTADRIGAYLAGVDFIGDKVNEVNGSGTGIYFKDDNTGEYIDKTPDLVDYIRRDFC